MREMFVYIDDVICSKFFATLLHRKITPVAIETYEEWISGAPQPTNLKENTFSYSQITLKYFVEGVDEKNALINISNLLKAHIKAKIRFSDLDLKFNTTLKSYTQTQIKEQFYELTLVLNSDFKLGKTKNLSLETDKVNCTSNVDTPCKLIITAINNCNNIIITLNNQEFTIPSLSKDDYLVINGEDYVIQLNDEDNLSVVELWEFPILKNGENIVSINNENIDLNIEYTERFI